MRFARWRIPVRRYRRLPVASAENIKVKGAAGFLAARVYRNTDEKSPTVVFFHGGGWVAGDLETHDRQARLLAIETGAVVVSVDYRRPPEVRFPGAFEDAFAAVRTSSNASPNSAATSSASASPATAPAAIWRPSTAIACRDAGIKLAAQLLVYPVTDVFGNFADAKENARFPSRAENAEGYFLSRAVMEWFCGHYLARRRRRRRLARLAVARQKPRRARAGDRHHGVVRSAARRGQGLCGCAFAAGVATKYYDGPGLIHGYFGLGEASEAARREAQRARADFKALLEAGA